MKDSRVLTGKILRFFQSSSPVREVLVNFVEDNLKKGTKSVALCFRGNAATLYYRCHQLLRIRSSHDGIVGEFDFRHARFTETYPSVLRRLEGLHVDVSRFCTPPEGAAQSLVRFSPENCSSDEFYEILEIYRGLIDDFFDPEKTAYAFGAPSAPHEKAVYIEKERQQQLWARYFLNDGLTYYDFEYSERSAAQQGLHGRFDLLGLRREPDGYTLLLTELKSSPQALWGKAGIADHERDYLNYLDSPLIAARKTEACETVKLLCAIFRRPCPDGLTPDAITGAKVQFVFSDRAIAAGKAYRPSDGRIEKAYFENEKL